MAQAMRVSAALAVAVVLLGCADPNDIIFGPEPLKQIAEQGDKFKKLSEEDRLLLVGYLTAGEIGKAFGADIKPATGRTVREVLADARLWREKMKVAEAEAKRREAEQAALKAKMQAEEAALKAKAIAERKAVADLIAASVTVVVTDKKVLPKNYEMGRYSDMLVLHYAIENKSDKTIRQLKGQVIFFDATGDKVGDLAVDFDERIVPKKTLRTTTGRGWRLSTISNGEIERIAGRDFASMKIQFEPEAVAFEGGQVLRAPDLK